MNVVRNYVAELCAVTFVIAIINAIAPKNNASKVCTMIGSILLIAVLISPIHKIDTTELSRIESRYGDEIKAEISRMNQDYGTLEKRIIEERLCAYVLNKANVPADRCSVDIEVSEKIPVSAEIKSADDKCFAEVSRVLENELLIPKERIKKEDK